jgi:hypothetical protein
MKHLIVIVLLLTCVGCGYTSEEMAGKQREIDALKHRLEIANNLHEQDIKNDQEMQRSIDQAKRQLNARCGSASTPYALPPRK